MYKTILTLLFAALLVPAVHATEEEPNDCQDKASWEEWDAKIKKAPGDAAFHMLHALRLGLCLKIERGDLTVDMATTIFEQARNTLIEKRREEKQMPRQAPAF